MNREDDEPFIEAVVAEFTSTPSKKRAVATVLLAQQRLHEEILNRVGGYLVDRLRKDISDLEAVAPVPLWTALQEKHVPWLVRRKQWPLNCALGLASEEDYAGDVFFGVRAPKPEKLLVGQGCTARGKLEGLRRTLPSGKLSPTWVWWDQLPEMAWGPEFAARLILESPTAEVADHPLMQELGAHFAQLAHAVDTLLKD